MNSSSEIPTHISDLTASDETTMVVKAHLHVERSINTFIKRCVPFPEAIDDRAIGFAQHVQVALAFGLEPEVCELAKRIGKIRNEFAHKLDAKLDKQAMRDLYNSLGPLNREVIDGAFRSTQVKMEKGTTKFTELDAAEMFQLIAVANRQCIEASIANLDKT